MDRRTRIVSVTVWLAVVVALVVFGVFAIIRNQPQLVTLFVVLAVIFAILPSLLPLLSAAEQAQQHHELIDELVAIRVQLSDINQTLVGLTARAAPQDHGKSSSNADPVSRPLSADAPHRLLVLLTATIAIIGIILRRSSPTQGN